MFAYLITDPNFYTSDNFKYTLEKALSRHKPKFACYRNKKEYNTAEINDFLLCCEEHNTLPILNGSVEIALKYNFFGVHLTSLQYAQISNAKNEKLLTIASCHSREYIELCLANGADFVTLSPIFNSPNKGEPLGVVNFCAISDGYLDKIIALGGIINNEQIQEISKLNIAGYASIRYFTND